MNTKSQTIQKKPKKTEKGGSTSTPKLDPKRLTMQAFKTRDGKYITAILKRYWELKKYYKEERKQPSGDIVAEARDIFGN
ncbi:MAG: hypothetical protein KAJ75_09245 [Alphaproteobacteria bacterium]|nr:hypothetical protein [Alphaproteobacteria bacterium]